jgi:hypothetical protein
LQKKNNNLGLYNSIKNIYGYFNFKILHIFKPFSNIKNTNRIPKFTPRTHTKETPYFCTECNAQFSYRSTLKSHLAKIHNTQVPPAKRSVVDPRQSSPQYDAEPDPEKVKIGGF